MLPIKSIFLGIGIINWGGPYTVNQKVAFD